MKDWAPSVAALKQTLARRYRLEQHNLPFSTVDWTVFSVANGDELLDELLKKGEAHEDVVDERIPYWADLWPASVGMAGYLLEGSSVQAGQEVLELGCGLGLAGMAARQQGAEVLLTDYLEAPYPIIRLNWLLNLKQEPRFEQMDWRSPRLERRYDWIIAADVAYEARAFEPLMAAFAQLLKPDGKVLISEPGRAVARAFVENFQQHGYQVTHQQRTLPFRGIVSRIHLYELQRSVY